MACLREGLGHLAQERFGDLDGLVGREVQRRISEALLDPLGQLGALVRPRIALHPPPTHTQRESEGTHTHTHKERVKVRRGSVLFRHRHRGHR